MLARVINDLGELLDSFRGQLLEIVAAVLLCVYRTMKKETRYRAQRAINNSVV